MDYMKKSYVIFFASYLFSQNNFLVDHEMVAKIREEGFQRSEIANTLSYMTDVLGARLTNSDDMRIAQDWAIKEMKRIGLKNTKIDPFMDYGVSWDNEFFSLHLLEPDKQVMVGYPIAHTPGIDGRKQLSVELVEIKTKGDLNKYKGKLKGKAVLATPPPKIDLDKYRTGTPRYTENELLELSQKPFPNAPRSPRPPRNPDLVSSVERNLFFKDQGRGIPQRLISRITERFYRTPAAKNRVCD